MTDLTLTSSNVSYAEPIYGMYMVRITNCDNADTLTFPVKSIINVVAGNETTTGATTAARTTATKVTFACSANDEVNCIVYALK